MNKPSDYKESLLAIDKCFQRDNYVGLLIGGVAYLVNGVDIGSPRKDIDVVVFSPSRPSRLPRDIGNIDFFKQRNIQSWIAGGNFEYFGNEVGTSLYWKFPNFLELGFGAGLHVPDIVFLERLRRSAVVGPTNRFPFLAYNEILDPNTQIDLVRAELAGLDIGISTLMPSKFDEVRVEPLSLEVLMEIQRMGQKIQSVLAASRCVVGAWQPRFS